MLRRFDSEPAIQAQSSDSEVARWALDECHAREHLQMNAYRAGGVIVVTSRDRVAHFQSVDEIASFMRKFEVITHDDQGERVNWDEFGRAIREVAGSSS